MEKTYSQKLARVFEIVDYFLLLPAAVGLLYATILISDTAWFTLLIYTIFVIGFALLIGYFKHSRGSLIGKYISALWITTAIYNFALLFPCLLYVAILFQTKNFGNLFDRGNAIAAIFCLSVVFGYITAIVTSLKAYSLEKRKRFLSYRMP